MINAILVDFKYDENWSFFNGVKENSTGDWVVLEKVSNKTQKSFFNNMARYIKYFFFAFRIFCGRKKYDKIIAWQQFYGIFLCFFLRFFGCKKGPNVTILTFIFKEKNGLKGKLYKKFVNYALGYNNINKIVVLSSYEVEKYKATFANSNKKFVFCKIGNDNKPKFDIVKGDYYLSPGRSNRDYDFLVNAFKKIDKKLVIISDTYKNRKIPKNITILDSCFKDDYEKQIANCRAVIISLDDIPISSGQLVCLKAYQYQKPIIVTNNLGIIDYVTANVDGFIINKNYDELFEAIRKIEDDDIYDKMAKHSKLYTLYDYGKNVAELI